MDMNTSDVASDAHRTPSGEHPGTPEQAFPSATTEPHAPTAAPHTSPGTSHTDNDSAPAGSFPLSPELTALLDAPASHGLIRDLLTAIGQAFTHTASARDVLPETAPGSAEQGLAALAGIDHLRSAIAELDATWQVATDLRIHTDDAAHEVPTAKHGAATAHELALARRVSPATSSLSLKSARELVGRMPHTRGALAAGLLTERQAANITQALATAGPDTVSTVDDLLGTDPGQLDGAGPRRTRDIVHQIIQQLDPEGSRARAQQAARSRRVTCTPLEDGMARISAKVRALDAAALMNTLETRAKADKAAGDKTAFQCLQADHLIWSVITPGARPDTSTRPTDPTTETGDIDVTDIPEYPGAPTPTHAGASPTTKPTTPTSAPAPGPAPVRIELGIIITDRALFDHHDDSSTAIIDGYGTIPAHIVRDTLQGHPPGEASTSSSSTPLATSTTATDTGPSTAPSTGRTTDPPDKNGSAFFSDPLVEVFFRRLYTHPRTGELLAMDSTSRRFPLNMRRFFRWRDVTCRTAWCNARIQQYDHIHAHAAGGRTSITNGQALCTRCNLMKEHGTWKATIVRDQNTDQTGITTTSPHGARGTSPTPATGPRTPHAA